LAACALGLAAAGTGTAQEPPIKVQPPKPGAPPGPAKPGEPTRRPDLYGPFRPEQVRLPLLQPGDRPPLGVTPKPSPETLKAYKEFIGDIIDPEVPLDLIVGQPRLILLRDTPVQIQVADESIANYTLLSPRELSILGFEVGTTVMNMWFTDPKDKTKQRILSFLIRVSPDPEARARLERVYKALEEEVNRAFPDSWVCITLVGDKVVLSGQAKDVAEAAQILRIVQANAPGQAAQIPVENITLNLQRDPFGFDPAAPAALQQYLLAGAPNIINLLRVPGEQQVMLRVSVAEVNRAAARSIGLNFSITNDQGITVFQQTTGNLTGNLPTLLDNGQVALQINALRTLDFARSLAEPTLVTLNGQTASFQAGGQFPVPVVTGFTAAGLQGTSFVPFGVQLSFTPYVTDRDRIRLVVQADVSTRDLGQTANIGGTNVPGLNTRNFQTTVELREGQTLAVAGLIQTNYGGTVSRVPLAGDLPILGRAFAADSVTASEQELVILVTPELVHPLEPREVPALPGSDMFEPGDLEFYILGRLESRRAYDYRSPAMTDIDRMARYRHCDQIFIIGPHGHADGQK
jgi:pilus assembly protein CpaC